jgi:hypothetical protein
MILVWLRKMGQRKNLSQGPIYNYHLIRLVRKLKSGSHFVSHIDLVMSPNMSPRWNFQLPSNSMSLKTESGTEFWSVRFSLE